MENRGSVNGWCNSLNALSRGLGPPLAGGLFRLGCYLESSSFQLGRYLPFYVNMITAVDPGHNQLYGDPQKFFRNSKFVPPQITKMGMLGMWKFAKHLSISVHKAMLKLESFEDGKLMETPAEVCIRLVAAQSKTEPAETTAELPSA